MRKLVFWFVLLGLFTASCATTYHSGRTGKYQPFYMVSVTFYKEVASADSADHRFILEAKWEDAGAPLGYRVAYAQCDRGEPASDSVECLFATSNPEMSFDILQIWENIDNRGLNNQAHKGENVAPTNKYLCANVSVGISANELRFNNDGTLDPEYKFNLPSDYDDPTCKFKITERTMVNAMETPAKK